MRNRLRQAGAAARRAKRGGAAFALALCAACSAQAVIVSNSAGVPASPNTTAPVGFEDAWGRVGSIGGGSGVYLGNGYVLTARHVANNSVFEGVFRVDGVNHNLITGTSVVLSNPAGSGLSADSDVWLHRYAVPDTSPLHGLGVLEISDTTPVLGTGPALLIGEGDGQASTLPVNVGGANTGYAWDGVEIRRWGETFVDSQIEFGVERGNSGVIRDVYGFQSSVFTTLENRAIAAGGDSGGGLFLMGQDGPVLAGLMHVVTTFTDQDDETAAFGNRTYFSDLSFYLDQIRVVEGDLDGDGYVGAQDIEVLLANWGGPVTAGDWTLGDADGDGQVGELDLSLVMAHFGEGTLLAPGASALSATSVPEPGSGAALLVLMVLGWPGRTRSRGRRRSFYTE